MATGVAPPAGAWIETPFVVNLYLDLMSRPLRARGLKLPQFEIQPHEDVSRPLRARGLKRLAAHTINMTYVAPPAGAWIETRTRCWTCWMRSSRPLRARGLKRKL